LVDWIFWFPIANLVAGNGALRSCHCWSFEVNILRHVFRLLALGDPGKIADPDAQIFDTSGFAYFSFILVIVDTTVDKIFFDFDKLKMVRHYQK